MFIGSEGDRWRSAAEHGRRKMPLNVEQLQDGAESEYGKRYNVSPSGAVLVRPDGFVAWSTKSLDMVGNDAESVMAAVMARVVCQDKRLSNTTA